MTQYFCSYVEIDITDVITLKNCSIHNLSDINIDNYY